MDYSYLFQLLDDFDNPEAHDFALSLLLVGLALKIFYEDK